MPRVRDRASEENSCFLKAFPFGKFPRFPPSLRLSLASSAVHRCSLLRLSACPFLSPSLLLPFSQLRGGPRGRGGRLDPPLPAGRPQDGRAVLGPRAPRQPLRDHGRRAGPGRWGRPLTRYTPGSHSSCGRGLGEGQGPGGLPPGGGSSKNGPHARQHKNGDVYLGRQMCVLWCLFVFVQQI